MKRRSHSPRGRVREVLEELLWEAVVEREIDRLGRVTRARMTELRDMCRFTDERATRVHVHRRAAARAEAEDSDPDAPRTRTLVEDLDGRLEGSWVRRVAGMTPGKIRKLAPGTRLTDEQVEGILWSAKGRVDPASQMYSRPPRALTPPLPSPE